MVDNSLSPHGGVLVERVLTHQEAKDKIRGLPRLAVRDQIARECVNLAYGFFAPLDGFMSRADVDSVARNMTLESGYVWSIPIVFDVDQEELTSLEVASGDSIVLTYEQQPLALLEIQEIYSYDIQYLAQRVYGTTDQAHPGVRRTYAYRDRFVAGQITLVNPPVINAPFSGFWLTPRQLRKSFADLGWTRVVAHQSRNVPHAGHEAIMKGAWLAAGADGILVSAVIGEKKTGDYIDEAIVHAHDRLREVGIFKQDVHLTTTLLWICDTPDPERRFSTPWCVRTWDVLTICSAGTTPESAIFTTRTPRTRSSTTCPTSV